MIPFLIGWLYNRLMEHKSKKLMDQKGGSFQDLIPPRRDDRWLELLRRLVPIEPLVTSSAPVDPVAGLALPGAGDPQDPAMISAYYLSFYE